MFDISGTQKSGNCWRWLLKSISVVFEKLQAISFVFCEESSHIAMDK